ncbi:MAG: type II secretion system minor pseudopilin GspJ [Candidatus Parcubacteria bacterium]|nr:type II secretion system minor pseudopilin GspJ [Burkholderiales bacterium]
MRAATRCGGFSLVELLVAVAVLAVLAAISFRGLNSVLDAETGVAVETRRWNELAIVTSQLGRDLSLAIARTARDGAKVDQPALSLRQAPPAAGVGAGSQIALTRLGDDDGRGAAGDLRRIAWRLRNGTLEYLVWPSVDAAPGAQPLVSEVLQHIAGLQLRALGDDGAWSDAWPAGGGLAEALPRAVEVQILLASGARISRLFALR